jgi:hypothetical protein
MGNEQSSVEDSYDKQRNKCKVRRSFDTNFGFYTYNLEANSEWIHSLEDYMELEVEITRRKYETQHMACCLKLKNKFMKWLWKAREKIVMKKYHPNRMIDLLASGLDINDIDDMNVYFETT